MRAFHVGIAAFRLSVDRLQLKSFVILSVLRGGGFFFLRGSDPPSEHRTQPVICFPLRLQGYRRKRTTIWRTSDILAP